MNVKEYIGSGKLEAYILGSLTAEEHARVQADIAQHTELAEEVEALEVAMQRYATAFAKEPPPALQDKIWNAIERSARATNGADQPVQQEAPRTIPLPKPEYRKPAAWKYAAVWVALLGSALLNFVLYRQSNEARNESVAMNKRVTELEARQQRTAALAEQYRKSNDMMADEAMQTIVMHTVVKNHPMAATVYWNKDRGQAYVAMNALPHPPEGKQYQLWVMEHGKPKSMGVLPSDMANTLSVHKVDMAVTTGEAFAISLEKEGGSETPTEVYVVGKI